jgi:hypothetical protein
VWCTYLEYVHVLLLHAIIQFLQLLLNIDELLFNINETLPESGFPISTVQNEGNIQAHHISKNRHDPAVEEREIGRQPKLSCMCISFCFPGNLRWWFMSNGLCAFKSLQSVSKGCEKNNISRNQHNPTVYSRDMATGALLAPPNSALLSLAEFSLLSLTFFFFNWWPLWCSKGIFTPNYNFVPHLCLYVFYFIFHVNYSACFYLNR